MNHINHSESPNDSIWLWTIFACAMGAGVLYLPVNAGINGLWPILTIAIITVPMIYLAHNNLSKVVLIASKDSNNINDVISEHFNQRFCNMFAFCYFMAIYPLVLIYSVGLTNTSATILETIFGITYIPRPVLAFIILGSLLLITLTTSSIIRKITEYIALPLAGSLLLVSLYLIPKWDINNLNYIPTTFDFIETFWLTLPVVIFSFNFSAIVSTFTLTYLEKHKDPEKTTENILWRATWLLFIFIIFFIVSCTLSVDQAHMQKAKDLNMNILIYLSVIYDDPILHNVSPLIALIAMLGAFLGTFFGAREAVIGLIEQRLHKHKLKSQKINKAAIALIFVPCYVFAIMDTNIINVISFVSGPVMALLLFIFPVYAIYNIEQLKKYRTGRINKIKINFIFVIGLISFSAILYSFKYLFHFLK